MAYDVHIARTKNWRDASTAPITRREVDALIARDPELEWSAKDFVDMKDESGTVSRYWMIKWRGHPCFWWYRDHIECSRPNEAQRAKLAQMATSLNAFVVGDDGEVYGEDGASRGAARESFGQRVRRWLTLWRRRRRPDVQSKLLPFGVGDTVRDPWGNDHTVIAIDPKANHGLGSIRTRRRDGTEHVRAMVAHALELVRNDH